MKKLVFIGMFLIVFFTSVTSVSALRLGLEVGNPAAVLIIRPGPWDFKVGYNFGGGLGGDGGEFFHVSLDYRIVDSYKLVDFLHLYLGLGGFVQVVTAGDNSSFALGARIPVGLQAFLVKNTIEIFLEIVPTVAFYPSIIPPWDNSQGFQGYFGFTIKSPF